MRVYKPIGPAPVDELSDADKDRERIDILFDWLGDGFDIPDLICEEHPARVYAHGGCRGAGMPGVNIFRLWAIDEGNGHWSDCSTHNEPAYPNGPCDCGAENTAEGSSG